MSEAWIALLTYFGLMAAVVIAVNMRLKYERGERMFSFHRHVKDDWQTFMRTKHVTGNGTELWILDQRRSCGRCGRHFYRSTEVPALR